MRQRYSHSLWSRFSRITNRKLSVALTEPGQLILFLIAAIFLSLLLAGHQATAKTLFQSPQSPPVESEPAQPPPEQTVPEQPPIQEEVPPQQPTVEPSAVQPAESAPVPESAPISEPAAGSEEALSTEDLPPLEPLSPEPISEFEEETEGGNFVLDQIEFIDTLVVSGAYIWLCCGVIMFLLIPLFLMMLYLRGIGKINQEEGL